MPLLTPKAKLEAVYNAKLTSNGQATVSFSDFDLTDPAVYTGSASTDNTVIYLKPKTKAKPRIICFNFGRIRCFYFQRSNNSLKTVTPIDQFKWTAHLEMVGVFTR